MGKTATAIGLGDDLAHNGIPTVIVDLCHTGQSTAHLLGTAFFHEFAAEYGMDPDANMANYMLRRWDGDISDLAIQRDENLWIMPCAVETTTLSESLQMERFREERLVVALGDLPQKAVVIVDTPPVLNYSTDNALVACAGKKNAQGADQQFGGTILCPELVKASLTTQDMLFKQCKSLETGTQYEIRHLGWFASETEENSVVNKEARGILDAAGLRRLGEMPRRTAIEKARNGGKTLREYISPKDEHNKVALDRWAELGKIVREELHV